MIDFVAGIALGLLIGLLPGFHVNNLLPALLPIVPFAGVTFIVSLSVAFVFSSIIPAVLLRAPNEDTALLAQCGPRSARYAVVSAALASLLSIIVLAFYSAFLPQVYGAAKQLMPLVLAVILGTLVLGNGLRGLAIIGLSSLLGMVTFNGDFLLPLLSGFFGTSMLWRREKEDGKGQKTGPMSHRKLLLASSAAVFVSSIFSLLPAVSSALASTSGRVLARLRGGEFAAFAAATNASYMILSFYAFSLMGLTRSGSAAALPQYLLDENAAYFAGIALAAAGVSALATLWLLPRARKLASSSRAGLVGLAFLLAANLLFSGWYGLLVFFTAASISFLASRLRVPLVATTSALAFPTVLALLRLI